MGLFRRRREEPKTPVLDVVLSDPERPCHGCAHSAAGVPFPSLPSGERPCGFCVRNPEPFSLGDKGPRWYDGKTPPYKTPMDCYIATDRFEQQRIFEALDRIQDGRQTVRPRGDGFEFARACGWDGEVPEGPPTPGSGACCEGGPVEGHAYTCIEVLGLSVT